jgi:uncharacterized protein DUF1707
LWPTPPRASLTCVAQRTRLKASDADRDLVAERLRQAAADGRLLAHEFEHRLAIALRARTYGELDAVLADLPSARPARRRTARSVLAARPGLALALAIPVAVAAVLAAVVIITGLFVLWMLWMIAWLAIGHRRGWTYARHHHRRLTRSRGVAGSSVPWL